MTLRLILMRHAKSSWNKPVSDHERELNGRGRASAQAMGNWLRENDILPEEALISTSKRTRETFKGLDVKPTRVRFLEDLYHPSPAKLLCTLKSAQEKTVLIISHNPACANFADAMAKIPPAHKRFHDYPTCATWVATIDKDYWTEVEFGLARTIAFAVPREVLNADR
ncbi:MAG: SixA phosphatase family protein [Paracoccaceae bacterium]